MKERMYMEKKRLHILRERMEKIFPGGKAGTLLVYGGLFVLLLGLYAWQAWGKDPAKTQTKVAETSGQGMTAPALEARLEQTLSRIRGAGQVRVLITYETGGEKVTATVSTTDESLTQTQSGEAPLSRQLRETVQPATVTGEEGQEAIVLYEKEPQVRGVLVVAEGAGDPSVRLDLQRAVQAVTGAPLKAIEVFEMGYGS